MNYKTKEVTLSLENIFQYQGPEAVADFIIKYFPDGEIRNEYLVIHAQLVALRAKNNLYGWGESERVQYNRLNDHTYSRIKMIERLHPGIIMLKRVPKSVVNLNPIKPTSVRKNRIIKKTGATLENVVDIGHKGSLMLKEILDFCLKHKKIVTPLIFFFTLAYLMSLMERPLNTINTHKQIDTEETRLIPAPSFSGESWVTVLDRYDRLADAVKVRDIYPAHPIKIIREGESGQYFGLIFGDSKLDCEAICKNPYFIKSWPNIYITQIKCTFLTPSQDGEYWICE